MSTPHSSSFLIHQVDVREILPLRRLVLRPHFKTEVECLNEKDHLNSTFHFAAKASSTGLVIGILSLEIESISDFSSTHQYRLRGMATHPNFRRNGAGRALVLWAEKFLLDQRRADLLWFKAREVAFPFYESLQYQYHGEMFDIPQIGPHKVMYKHLHR